MKAKTDTQLFDAYEKKSNIGTAKDVEKRKALKEWIKAVNELKEFGEW